MLAWAVRCLCQEIECGGSVEVNSINCYILWVRSSGIPQRPRGGGSWCRTYRMLKFVVGFVELDSSMLGGSNVDPVVQFGSTLANNYNGRPII
jgi:hypothetical protein